MKYIISSFLILIILDGDAQDLRSQSDSILYNLYVHFCCDNQTEKITDYFIVKRVKDSIVEYLPDSSGTCLIPVDIGSEIELRTITLGWIHTIIDKNVTVFNDTITVPPIYIAPSTTRFTIGPTYYSYYYCGQKCHGLEKSYREDGSIWQKGRFKSGKLKSYKTYYPDGKLASKDKKRFLVGCKIHYNVEGKLENKMKYFLFISFFKI